jgi:hypothetical protein
MFGKEALLVFHNFVGLLNKHASRGWPMLWLSSCCIMIFSYRELHGGGPSLVRVKWVDLWFVPDGGDPVTGPGAGPFLLFVDLF